MRHYVLFADNSGVGAGPLLPSRAGELRRKPDDLSIRIKQLRLRGRGPQFAFDFLKVWDHNSPVPACENPSVKLAIP